MEGATEAKRTLRRNVGRAMAGLCAGNAVVGLACVASLHFGFRLSPTIRAALNWNAVAYDLFGLGSIEVGAAVAVVVPGLLAWFLLKRPRGGAPASRLAKGLRVAGVLLFLPVVIAAYGFVENLSGIMTVSPTSTGVEIQTLRFGEYCTHVSQLVVYDGSGKEFVRLVARDDNAVMRTVWLPLDGGGPQDEYLKNYTVSYPAGGPYQFRTGVSYIVVVRWSFLTSADTFSPP